MYGTYDRTLLSPLLRTYCPSARLNSIHALSGSALVQRGKRLVLLDVDNTLLAWKSMEIPAETTAWLADLRSNGLELCILSNTRHPKRLAKLAAEMGIEYIIGKKKPHPAIYREALEKFSVKPSEAIMIGDQLFTDILGANRAGIDGVLIDPCANIDFIGTRVLRHAERAIMRLVRPALGSEAKQ